jgi:hypothetical protein
MNGSQSLRGDTTDTSEQALGMGIAEATGPYYTGKTA